MARCSWFNETRGLVVGAIDHLDSWKKAMEDGVIEPHEVAEQKERVTTLLRELEPLLDDAQHARVTRVLEEWTVLQAMRGTLADAISDDMFEVVIDPDDVR